MRGKRILLVEDSATQAEVLRAVLEEDGLQVDMAASGEEALTAIDKTRPDLIVSDVVMPGMSGYDLCRVLKGRKDTADIPIVLLTSLSDPMAIVRGLECGADNYVTKPYTPEYLIARIRHTLDRFLLRPSAKTSMGVNVHFLDTEFTITSEREQILDLFISSIEDVVRTNDALQASQRELAQAQRQLEDFAGRMAHQAQVTAEKYSALMHSASDAIFVLDAEGAIVEANARASELLDQNARVLRGKQLDELAALESRDVLRAQLDRVAGLARVTASDVEFSRSDDSRIYCDLSASRARTRDGEFTLVILHDVTERRQLEQQLVQSQKMEAIGQLAGGIAHDFNNLLTVIRSYADLALEQTAAESPIQADLDEIKHAADSASALTRQLLAFSRKQIIQPRPLQLSSVARSMERMLARLIGEDIELVLDLGEKSGYILADPAQIEQVLMNLAVNARDAMPNGGRLIIGTASADLSPSDARLTADIQPGPYELLSVSDTGIGMDADVRQHIFEPFFTTKPQGHGTGLGLSTVYGAVKQSDGTIDVQTSPGQGTTFTIFLPRLEERPELIQPPAAKVLQSGRKTGTILLVEDEQQLRVLARRVLERSGYSVLEAGDGEQALGICAEHRDKIDLVLTDVVMPRMSVPEMVDRMAAICSDARILFMSGYAFDDILRRGLGEPRMNFLQKPFTPESLLAKVREVLSNGARMGTT